ncbi:division/cell wall cluster transcriptional repressor MraZ [Defluviimonas sp. WL0024]|uniref:Transcriptional regulator MraZ n=2 Tax=Albidovulum TaxID=205889 RepID=A0ABT3J5W1_9RHOB|nr:MULTISPECIES: division/cell wall cluster transcriptional repressor MraZ [Defluviimonas]MCU9849614.1 division/cell wall cluster transcriptional repressor MraZ [Defluviimonas sp. WL0024]MCW3783053.1 division/cell wall cluster transcriptional repressor MraZ [Defluviimonas salinarum]
MARRFRGSDTYKVDAKGRVSIPAPFRRVIEASDPDWKEGLRPNIVIVYGDAGQDWLEVYTMKAIEEIDEQIEDMQRGSPQRLWLEELMHGQSIEAQIDDDGRLTLPQKLREKIGLTSEAFFISAGDYFKIWKPETYQDKAGARTRKLAAQYDDDFDPRSLLPTRSRG